MPRPSPGRLSWARRCAAVVLVVSLPLSAGLSACRSTAEPSAAPERLSRADDQVRLASNPVETTTKIHRVFGRLPETRRKAVRRQVGDVVDRWWEAAYLGGTYPRSSFPSAFPGFTDAAERRARADKALLTNQTEGPARRRGRRRGAARCPSTSSRATGRARAVTAHVVLRFDSTGARAGTTVVRGRLFLTHKRGAWRIFGYDVAKGVPMIQMPPDGTAPASRGEGRPRSRASWPSPRSSYPRRPCSRPRSAWSRSVTPQVSPSAARTWSGSSRSAPTPDPARR